MKRFETRLVCAIALSLFFGPVIGIIGGYLLGGYIYSEELKKKDEES